MKTHFLKRKPWGRLGRWALLLLLLTVSTRALAEENGPKATENADSAASFPLHPFPFSRDVLLARFDKDQDRRLTAAEQAEVRTAFGDIDVPMLPWPPLNYCRVDLPKHFQQAGLSHCDNTPADNPITDHGATLGRVLFYDRQLSKNNTIACASCHLQDRGFADPRPFSLGFKGGHTKRNGMGLVNLRYTNVDGEQPGFFWDERAPTLEAQVLMPIQDPVEMGMQLPELESKLQSIPYYPPLFQAAFGSPQVTSDRIAKALAQFLRSIVSLNSRFDRAASKSADPTSDFPDFSKQENLGKRLFFEGVEGFDEFACAMCHIPPAFSMPAAMNIGLELNYSDPGLGALNRPNTDPFSPSNEGKFKAPSLRNVALTAPYMHDGRFKTVEEVLKHYSQGVQRHPNLSLAFRESEDESSSTAGFGFTDEQIAALVAFLKTLTDEQLPSDERFSDPFLRANP